MFLGPKALLQSIVFSILVFSSNSFAQLPGQKNYKDLADLFRADRYHPIEKIRENIKNYDQMVEDHLRRLLEEKETGRKGEFGPVVWKKLGVKKITVEHYELLCRTKMKNAGYSESEIDHFVKQNSKSFNSYLKAVNQDIIVGYVTQIRKQVNAYKQVANELFLAGEHTAIKDLENSDKIIAFFSRAPYNVDISEFKVILIEPFKIKSKIPNFMERSPNLVGATTSAPLGDVDLAFSFEIKGLQRKLRLEYPFSVQEETWLTFFSKVYGSSSYVLMTTDFFKHLDEAVFYSVLTEELQHYIDFNLHKKYRSIESMNKEKKELELEFTQKTKPRLDSTLVKIKNSKKYQAWKAEMIEYLQISDPDASRDFLFKGGSFDKNVDEMYSKDFFKEAKTSYVYLSTDLEKSGHRAGIRYYIDQDFDFKKIVKSELELKTFVERVRNEFQGLKRPTPPFLWSEDNMELIHRDLLHKAFLNVKKEAEGNAEAKSEGESE